MATNLDSDEALDAFKTMCDFFTQYQQPYTYDFANRFRTGEMPLGIADYSLYNQLTVFAPEIKGLWEFVQLPGSERTGIDENGNTYKYVDHTAPSGIGSVMIMKKKGNEENKYRASWNYIKWWTSTDIQGLFGNEQVAIIGTAAKYNTANKNAMLSQSWSADERRAIEQQFESLEGTPMTPGNYIVGRNQEFAFLAVYNNGTTPAEAMQSYISDINKELSRKRDEYDLRIQEETLEEYKLEQEERLSELNDGKPVKLDYLGKLAQKEKERNAQK
jgi:ABC-type glycerol-3-phosphate transport system substrate-binding protein